MELTYLDNAATTFPKPESVYEAIDCANRKLAVNAGRGSYALAREATHLIDSTRNKALEIVHGEEVADAIFAPSATIALNMIIDGLTWTATDVCYVSAYEHNAVMRPLYAAQKKYGFTIVKLPLCETDGTIDLEKVKYLFSVQQPTKLFVTHISNVTGYILPIQELTGLAKQYGCEVVIDASQSLGLLELDMTKCMADFVVFAGHKNLYGPFGIGGFFMRKSAHLQSVLAGGTGSDSLNLEMPKMLPGRLEPASPNVVAIAGLHEALTGLCEKSKDYKAHEEELTKQLVDELGKIKQVVLYAPPKEQHIGIVAFNIKGYMASDVGMLLDEDYNIAVRTGYHCAPWIHEHLKNESYGGVVRASVGRYTTKEDVLRLVEAVKELGESI